MEGCSYSFSRNPELIDKEGVQIEDGERFIVGSDGSVWYTIAIMEKEQV